MTNTTVVPVKSAWSSKINWLQLIGVLSTAATGLLTVYNGSSPAEVASWTGGVASITKFATWIIRTWFTPAVISASVD